MKMLQAAIMPALHLMMHALVLEAGDMVGNIWVRKLSCNPFKCMHIMRAPAQVGKLWDCIQ